MTIAELHALTDGLDPATEIVVNEAPRGNGNELEALPVVSGNMGLYVDRGESFSGLLVTEHDDSLTTKPVLVLSHRT